MTLRNMTSVNKLSHVEGNFGTQMHSNEDNSRQKNIQSYFLEFRINLSLRDMSYVVIISYSTLSLSITLSVSLFLPFCFSSLHRFFLFLSHSLSPSLSVFPIFLFLSQSRSVRFSLSVCLLLSPFLSHSLYLLVWLSLSFSLFLSLTFVSLSLVSISQSVCLSVYGRMLYSTE